MIVEDEKHAMLELEEQLSLFNDRLLVSAKAKTLGEAIKMAELHRPDIVFLDIKLGNESGFELLEHYKDPSFETIVVTAYDHFLIEALHRCAADFLLKPVSMAQLGDAVNRVIARIEKESQHRKQVASNLVEYWQWLMIAEHKQLSLPVAGELLLVTLSEIQWLESSKSYTKFCLANGVKYLVSRGLYQYIKELEPLGFVRCHKGYLVNRRYVRKLLNNKSRVLELVNGNQVPVSRHYFQSLKQALTENNRFWSVEISADSKL